MTRLMTAHLTLGYGARTAVDRLDLEIPHGRVTCLVGSNGCGKSTILRGLARVLAPMGGRVILDGRSLREWPAKPLARRLAFLPQHPSAPDGLTVRDLVAYGRYPHQSLFGGGDPGATDAVAAAINAVGLNAFADRPVGALSGGERQRAWIALVLCQQTPILLLDEPTTYLDIGCQLDILTLLRDLSRRERLTVVLSLHDINMAARHADHVVMLRGGAVVAAGPPRETVTTESMARVFGVHAHVTTDPASGAPMIWPIAAIAAPVPA